MTALLRIALIICALLATSRCEHKVSREMGLTYGVGVADSQPLLVDVFQPAGTPLKLRAALLLVHGGAWSAGDRSECHELAEYFASQGYVSFAVGYRLVTPTINHWPAQLDDTQRAVRWVRANADRFSIDPNRVGALGGSAGGHIVACLGTMETRDNSDISLAAYSSRVNCVINMCGPTDLSDDHALKSDWADEQVAILLGGKPSTRPELARSASPLLYVTTSSAPAFMIQGRNDELVQLHHAERFAEALTKAGVKARVLVHGGGHGIDDGFTLVKCLWEIAAFMNTHLPP